MECQDYAILTRDGAHASALSVNYLLTFSELAAADAQEEPDLKRNMIGMRILPPKNFEVWLILAIIRFEIKSLFCLTLTRRFAPPVSPGLQVIRPLQHAAVSELGLHDHVRRPAAHRELPAAENHRQRQLRQGQAGTTRPHRERGERAGSDGCQSFFFCCDFFSTSCKVKPSK